MLKNIERQENSVLCNILCKNWYKIQKFFQYNGTQKTIQSARQNDMIEKKHTHEFMLKIQTTRIVSVLFEYKTDNGNMRDKYTNDT